MATESTAVAKLEDLQIPGLDEKALAKLTDEQKVELMEFYSQELLQSKEGVQLQPPRLKISKDTLTFVDDTGGSHREIDGVIVFKHVARGLWDRDDKDNNAPVCSSLDGIFGNPDERGIKLGILGGQKCGVPGEPGCCPFNEWGTGTDEKGNPTDGKACKEMRRVFLATAGAELPAVLTLPPTSIKPFDKYISARINQRIADIGFTSKLSLRSEKRGGFNVAVIECELGSPVPPQQMLKLAKLRNDIKEAAARMGVDEVDYETTAAAEDDTPFSA